MIFVKDKQQIQATAYMINVGSWGNSNDGCYEPENVCDHYPDNPGCYLYILTTGFSESLT